MDRLEGRNPVLECLQRGQRKVHRVWIDQGAKPDDRVSRIRELAEAAGAKLHVVERQKLDRMAEGRVHNGVIAEVDPVPTWSTAALLDVVYGRGEAPFVILADGLQYEHNLGAVLRTALGFGASGVVLPTRRGADPVSPVVQRVAMGAVEVVPIVRESLFVALSELKRAAVPIIGADADGEPLGTVDLRGAVAIVLGEEGSGLSPKLREKCDRIVSIPLMGELESLNVSVAAAILMYEKRRQDAAGG
ncbi:MAG: 23S rRNA (guanosine(2251)-2'-O)-methyltransferase RlmB [Myxococcota bacterium]